MKKSLIALAMIAAMGSAFAEGTTASIDYQVQQPDVKGTGPDQYQTTLEVKHKITDLFAVDATVSAAQNDNFAPGSSKNYQTTTRAEIGLTAQQAVFGPVDAYGRLAIGQEAPSGTEAFAYNSEELGVVAHLPKGFDAKLGYRWRQAFDTDLPVGQTDTTRTTRLGLAYNINKSNVVSVNYDITKADTANGGDTNAVHVTYAFKF